MVGVRKAAALWDLFNIARSILVQLLSSFFFISFVSVHVVHPYSSIDTTAAWKKLHFILSDRSDFHMTDSPLITVQTFASRVLISFSVDETLLPTSVSLSTNFKDLPFSFDELCFVCLDIEAYGTCCPFQTMPQGLDLGRRISY